jgi:hypothetical protein
LHEKTFRIVGPILLVSPSMGAESGLSPAGIGNRITHPWGHAPSSVRAVEVTFGVAEA